MTPWTDKENQALAEHASTLTSTQMSKGVLKNRTPKAIRHQAEKLEIRLTAHKKNSDEMIALALELRQAGFYRDEIEEETGVSPTSQYKYEMKQKERAEA